MDYINRSGDDYNDWGERVHVDSNICSSNNAHDHVLCKHIHR